MKFLDDLIITTHEIIIVVNNSCDQSIINLNIFLINYFSGVLYNVGDALHGMQSFKLKSVRDIFALAILLDNIKIISRINIFLILIRLKQKHY